MPDTLVIILGSGVVAAFVSASIQGIFKWLDARGRERRSARLSALKLAVELERFSMECGSQVARMATFRDSRGADGRESGELPTAPIYDPNIEWDLLHAVTSARALSLPNELIVARAIAENEEGDPTEPPYDLFMVLCEQGLKSWSIAEEARRLHDAKPLHPEELGWDFVEVMNRELELAQRSRKLSRSSVEIE